MRSICLSCFYGITQNGCVLGNFPDKNNCLYFNDYFTDNGFKLLLEGEDGRVKEIIAPNREALLSIVSKNCMNYDIKITLSHLCFAEIKAKKK